MKNLKRFISQDNVLEPEHLREAVKQAYTAVATNPSGKHPFPVGRSFAENIGYPRALLDRFPESVLASFTGVANISLSADVPAGSIVLDVGCGTGLDSLIAAEKAGPRGQVIGIDFSLDMLRTARAAAHPMSNKANYCCADAENLPVGDQTVDVIMVNGICNLNPFRSRIVTELSRVIKDNGTLYIAELIQQQADQKAVSVFHLKDWFT